MATKSKVSGQRKITKIKGPWSQKMAENQRCTVKEKQQKGKGLGSDKNGKESNVQGQRKMAKNQKFVVRVKWQKPKHPWSKKNGKTSKFRGRKNSKK